MRHSWKLITFTLRFFLNLFSNTDVAQFPISAYLFCLIKLHILIFLTTLKALAFSF